jgi:hypothetical protein
MGGDGRRRRVPRLLGGELDRDRHTGIRQRCSSTVHDLGRHNSRLINAGPAGAA